MTDFKDALGAGDREEEQARMGAKSYKNTQSEGVSGDDIAAERPEKDTVYHKCMEEFRVFQLEVFKDLAGDAPIEKKKWRKYLELKAFIDTLGDNPKETDAALGRLMRLQGFDDKNINISTKKTQEEAISQLFAVEEHPRFDINEN